MHLRAEADHLLNMAKGWFYLNRLKLNEEKTQNLLCTLKNEPKEEEAVKLLGFWIDPKLSWNQHITKVCVKLSRVLYLLRKLKLYITQRFLLTIYHALFQSHVAYGIVLWGHSSATRDVLLLQKRALRIITSAGIRDHCRPIFKELGVLTVFSLYVLNALTLLKENINDFNIGGDHHRHVTRHAHDLDIPRCRLSLTQKGFPVYAIKVYNSLPDRVRNLDAAAFKAVMKDCLVDRPLYSLDELSEEPLIK